MRRAGVQRGVAGIALAAMVATGCGGDPQEQSGSSKQSSAAGDRPPKEQWVLAMDYNGASGNRIYVLLDPDTGQTTHVPLPGETDTSADPQDVLQVSAHHDVVIGASNLSDEEEESATLTLFPMKRDSEGEVLDLRTITGDPLLHPVAAAFDSVDPDLIRVITEEGDVWEINFRTKGAEKAAQGLDLEDGSASFDPRNGQPYVEGTSVTARPFEGWPQPGGEILEDEESYPELPEGEGAVFQTDSGELWSFRVEGSVFRVYRAESADAAWEIVELDPQPPIQAGEGVFVEWVKPPVK